MSEHTKTPWIIDEVTDGRCSVVGPEKQSILDTWSINEGVDHKANARHIVHCVNNHERLVEALVNVKAGLEAKLVGSPEFTLESMIEGVSRALAALEAEKGGEL